MTNWRKASTKSIQRLRVFTGFLISLELFMVLGEYRYFNEVLGSNNWIGSAFVPLTFYSVQDMKNVVRGDWYRSWSYEFLFRRAWMTLNLWSTVFLYSVMLVKTILHSTTNSVICSILPRAFFRSILNRSRR